MNDVYNILIVDDDINVINIIKELLDEKIYNFYCAQDGIEALNIINNTYIHLVIMDIMMPKMDGISAILKIRNQKNMPILILSAKSEENDRVLGLSAGADDYLVKPFYKSELIARVNSLIRRYTTLGSLVKNNDNLLVYHDIIMDVDKKKVIIRNNEVKFTATEFKILELLLSNPGHVFSASQIYEQVWDSNSYSVENTVMIHISRLRKKIEINPNKPDYIKVVWGIGYKLEI